MQAQGVRQIDFQNVPLTLKNFYYSGGIKKSI